MNDSIGAKLREAREKRQLTLQQASDTTKVRIHYLQALENDDVSAMPSAAQARGFLRIYAEFLGLEVADLVPTPSPVAPVPTPAPSTEAIPPAPATAPTQSQASRPGLLDSARELLPRLRKRAGSAEAAEPDSTDSVLREPSDREAKSPKKKATK